MPQRRRSHVDPSRFAVTLAAFMAEHNLSQAEAAERLGVGQSRISSWLNTSAAPSKATLDRILPAMGLRAENLQPGTSTPGFISNVVLIPRGGHIGGGALPLPPDEPDADPYPAGELRRLLGFDPSGLVSAVVVGDSMAPRLRASDKVIYLPTTEIADHGLYILLLDGAQVIKTVQRLGGGALSLIPANPDYRTETFTPVDDADGDHFRSDLSGRTATLSVVGKVVWYPTLA